MFEHHKKSPWFSEKYDPAPEFQGMRTRVRKFGWRGRMDVFISELESGNFDPDFTEHAPETSSPAKENVNGEATSANGASADAGVVEETKPAVPASGEEDMQFNVEAEEDAGDDANRGGDKNRRPVANRGEEIAVPPEGNQIMIRTIPPDIGRAKLEEVCASNTTFRCSVLTWRCSPSASSLDLFTSRSEILFRKGTTTVQAGSSSATTPTCLPLWRTCQRRR